MAREGIYVGGHEIVERYVGSQLVWRKWKFLRRFENLGGALIDNYDSLSVSISGNSNIGSFDRFDTGKKPIKIVVSNNEQTEVFSAIQAYVYTKNSGESNYNRDPNLHIVFNTKQEALDFKERFLYRGTIDIYI